MNIRRCPLISPLPTAGEGVGEGAFRTNPSCAWRAPHASSGGLFHHEEHRDKVGADGEEKDVQAGKRQRSDRGRPGRVVVDAKEKPMDGARESEQVAGQPLPAEEEKRSGCGPDGEDTHDLIDVPGGASQIGDPHRGRKSFCQKDQYAEKCHAARPYTQGGIEEAPIRSRPYIR